MPGLRPPYPEIYEQLMKGRVIPFLGAGAPLYARNPRDTPWSKADETTAYLPTASELADYLARRTDLPAAERGDLTKMAQYFEAVLGPEPLRRRLRDIFSYAQPPTPLHEFLATVPAPLLIVTTNYDDLIELALFESEVAFDLFVVAIDRGGAEGSVHGATLFRPAGKWHQRGMLGKATDRSIPTPPYGRTLMSRGAQAECRADRGMSVNH